MMRLLKRTPNDDLQLVKITDDQPPPYAILSHTWAEGQEVTYDELVAGTGKDKTGYAKILFCTNRAAQDGIEYSWYQGAAKCYAYLSDVHVPNEVSDAQAFPISWAQSFRQSRWFTRGWTLQELLAPASVEFFSGEGKLLGNRISLEREVCEITKIPIKALRGQRLSEFSVAERMSWAAERMTTFKEDKVYCLLGIFGVFLPLIYGEGDAYAKLRLREEIERRRNGQGIERVQDLDVLSPLPFPRNELFTGRKDELRYLDDFLTSNSHRRMTVYGLGGCGKSALAVEFAYRVLSQRTGQLVFWVPAMSRESFELAYREIGMRLRIPGITDDNANIKQLVKDSLDSSSTCEWLMIVDNADDPQVLMSSTNAGVNGDLLVDYLPKSDRGKIVFTTRSGKAAGELTQSSKLELKDIGNDGARQLLLRRITKQSLLTDTKAVDELLELLAYLPLAIAQAAAFIDNNDISVRNYISLIQNAGSVAELFGERFEDPNRYQEMDSTIAKTWHVSFDQVRKQDVLAAEYLSFMACVDRINIPQSLLPPHSSPVQQAKAIGTLKGYAFVSERQQVSPGSASEIFFDMHRLVHMAATWWLDGHDEQKAWVAKAAARLEELLPDDGYENMDTWTRYLPHASHVAGLDGELNDETRASLLDRVGRCQLSLGQYSAAEITFRQALSVRERTLGIDDELILLDMNEIGVALDRQGKYSDAEIMYKRTLAMNKKVRGAKHPDTLTGMNNLASVLYSQGKYEEAETMYKETLAMSKKVLGAEHPKTLLTMSNWAFVLNDQGKYKEAESINRQTLAKRKNELGVEHLDTLKSMNNLASVLYSQGKYEEAETIYKETLAMRKKVLGAEHPNTLSSLYNLAFVLGYQGKFEEATIQFDKACAGLVKVLGQGHPLTRKCHKNYSSMLASQRQRRSGNATEGLEVGVNVRRDRESTLSRIGRRLGFKNYIS